MAKTIDDFVREAQQVVPEVGPAEVQRLVAAGALALDVREAGEVARGTVPDAMAIPRGRLELDAPDWIFDPEGPIVVVCSTGRRSILAARLLREMGFVQACSLAGGLDAWQAAGLPLGPARPA